MSRQPALIRCVWSQRFAPSSFKQGVVATGVYLVESGEARVLLPTGQSQRQLLQVVGPRTMLGLSESMSGERCRITAEAGEPTTAAFVPRERVPGVSARTW
jgi:CRP-like cAMP-binding protein